MAEGIFACSIREHVAPMGGSFYATTASQARQGGRHEHLPRHAEHQHTNDERSRQSGLPPGRLAPFILLVLFLLNHKTPRNFSGVF